jgi:peptidyl-tRNA hydrolase, PTH1 family
MKLIVGLGNPGPEYEKTRHNVGFLVLDRLARRHAPGEVARARFHGALLEGSITGEKMLLLKPGTYMNRSGAAVAEAARFYKLDPAADLLVIVDDIALPCGSIRIRGEGGAGGHNGLADIEQKLGGGAYARLRIGIGAPGQIPQAEYVLGRFRPDQLELVEPALDRAADAAACWAERGVIECMNRFNRNDQPESVQGSGADREQSRSAAQSRTST